MAYAWNLMFTSNVFAIVYIHGISTYKTVTTAAKLTVKVIIVKIS